MAVFIELPTPPLGADTTAIDVYCCNTQVCCGADGRAFCADRHHRPEGNV